MSEIKKNSMKNNPTDLEYLWERLAGVKNIRIIERKKVFNDSK